MVHALIFAGGTGTRMKSADIPKQFIEVDGKEIIIRTLEHFSSHEGVDTITVVCLEGWIDHLRKQIERYHIQKISAMIPGGKTGYESIHLGLLEICGNAAQEDIVLICDGVRPMLSRKLLDDCIRETHAFGSAVPVTPSIDSVLVSENGNSCSKHMERKQIYITQAPQGYKLKRIMDAHQKAEIQNMTNAVSSADLLLDLGEEIHLFLGERTNIKATTPEDLDTLRSTYYYEHHKRLAIEENKYS